MVSGSGDDDKDDKQCAHSLAVERLGRSFSIRILDAQIGSFTVTEPPREGGSI